MLPGRALAPVDVAGVVRLTAGIDASEARLIGKECQGDILPRREEGSSTEVDKDLDLPPAQSYDFSHIGRHDGLLRVR